MPASSSMGTAQMTNSKGNRSNSEETGISWRACRRRREGIPETVLLRLITERGRPSVEIREAFFTLASQLIPGVGRTIAGERCQ